MSSTRSTRKQRRLRSRENYALERGPAATIRVHRSIATVMPDVTQCDLRTQINVGPGTLAGAATYWLGFKAGSPISVGVSNITNTAPTSGSTFAANYPAGLQYLLGSAGGGGAPYGKYRVLRSSIKIMVTSGTTNSQGNTNVVLFPTNDYYSYSGYSFQTLMEQPFAVRKMLGNWASNDSVVNLSKTLTPEKVYGLIDPQLVRVDAYTGSYNTDPTNNWWWYVVLQNTAGSGGAAQVLDMQIELVQRIEFFDRNVQASGPPV
jgi:hypothetical protein